MAEITELKGLEIKLLPIKLLVNNEGQIEGVPKNPRFIKDWRYKLLLQSLTESPEMLSLKELWVYKVGNIYVVIAGNMRLRGSKEKGYKSLPCKILPPETTIEKLKEYAIKDNAGYGDWEMDSLANEWESPKIVEWGVELHGWENGEMPFEESETAEAKEDDFDTTPPAVAKTVLGDLYEIGEHRLLCADCTDVTAVDRLMGGERADLVFTDPPYGIDWNTDYTRFTGGLIPSENTYDKIQNDKTIFDPSFWLSMFDTCFFFGANCFSDKLPKGNWIVWDKRFENGQAFLADAEVAWYNGSGAVYIISETHQGFVSSDKKRYHPTQKPVKLLEKIFEKIKAPNTLIDPYIGSGTTMVAAHQLKRKVYGCEISPQYCDVIVKRMLNLDSTLRVKRNGVDVTEEWRA